MGTLYMVCPLVKKRRIYMKVIGEAKKQRISYES